MSSFSSTALQPCDEFRPLNHAVPGKIAEPVRMQVLPSINITPPTPASSCILERQVSIETRPFPPLPLSTNVLDNYLFKTATTTSLAGSEASATSEYPDPTPSTRWPYPSATTKRNAKHKHVKQVTKIGRTQDKSHITKVTKSSSHRKIGSASARYRSIKLVQTYDFYTDPQRTSDETDPLYDPVLFAPPRPPTRYSDIVLPKLHKLVYYSRHLIHNDDISHQIAPLPSLINLLSKFPDFGVSHSNLTAFRKYVESRLPYGVVTGNAGDPEKVEVDHVLAIKPEKTLKMIFRINNEVYNYHFPRRAGVLLFPDDFEPKPWKETTSREMAGMFPQYYECRARGDVFLLDEESENSDMATHEGQVYRY